MADEELKLPEPPKSIGLLTNNDILIGSPVPAIDRLKIVSEEQFEDIIREWVAGYCQSKYIKVWRAGGARDKGRDVVAIIDDSGIWDNFQSKHYDHPLMPSDIWLELGKLCYYTFSKAFTLPRRYYFVAPQGVGPTVGDLLLNPKQLKISFLLEWDKICKGGITKKTEIPLSVELEKHIESIDFSLFTFLDPQELIEQHKKTNYYPARFGGGLKKRERPIVNTFSDTEIPLRYVQQLFEAYSDYLSSKVLTINELSKNTELLEHFNRQRECFHWADTLNQFSRDSLPAENTCFEELKDEIHHGVVDTNNDTYSSGYENVKKTITTACSLNIESNALLSVVKMQDKIGICHHLANENKLTWVKS